MEGRGVTNYAVDKPSFGYSTRTTEFDDELLRRNIIDMEQAMVAKGASLREAQRLVELNNKSRVQEETTTTTSLQTNNNDDSCLDRSDDDGDSSDDEFLKKYRAMRLSELKEESQERKSNTKFGKVVSISRPEWTREVNDASHEHWVVVVLTRDQHAGCQLLQQSIQTMANLFKNETKFVAIPSREAIRNWPDANLPTLFSYSKGKMQHELTQVQDTSVQALTRQFAAWGIISLREELQQEEDDDEERIHSSSQRYQGTTFGGTMSSLATRRDENDSSDDDW